MVATVLAFSLVACGPVDSAVQNLAGAASNKGSDVVTADYDGYAEGRIGDVMRTYFFDYTVNSAYTCKEFEGYTPAEGNKLLVAELTVKNTDRSTVTMYDTDFQIQSQLCSGQFSFLINHIDCQCIAIMIIPHLVRFQAVKVGHLSFCQHEINAAPQISVFLFQQTFLKIATLHMGFHFQMFNIILR